MAITVSELFREYEDDFKRPAEPCTGCTFSICRQNVTKGSGGWLLSSCWYLGMLPPPECNSRFAQTHGMHRGIPIYVTKCRLFNENPVNHKICQIAIRWPVLLQRCLRWPLLCPSSLESMKTISKGRLSHVQDAPFPYAGKMLPKALGGGYCHRVGTLGCYPPQSATPGLHKPMGCTVVYPFM